MADPRKQTAFRTQQDILQTKPLVLALGCRNLAITLKLVDHPLKQCRHAIYLLVEFLYLLTSFFQLLAHFGDILGVLLGLSR
jgi:hypothetical protein